MHKRILAIVTLLCAIPVLACAWSLNTWVKSPGGTVTINKNGGSQPASDLAYTSANGSVFKTYTSTTNLKATIAPSTGYYISSLVVNGNPITPAVSGSQVVYLTPDSTTATGFSNVWAEFLRAPLALNVVAGSNGMVTPSGLQPNVYRGLTYRVFSFIPARGQAVTAVTADVPGNITFVTSPLNITNKKVTVTVTSITGPATLTGVFSGTVATGFGSYSAAATGTPLKAARACDACHLATRKDTSRIVSAPTFNAQTILKNWSTSTHKVNRVICAQCHQGSSTGSHPGQVQCISCHGATGVNGGGAINTAATDADNCAHCHSPGGTWDHRAGATTITSCIACHDVAAPAHVGNVNDNNGVRAITTEFAKWSHHVTGVALQDAHCAACHLEGEVVGGFIVPSALHMSDAQIHLRNADTDADMAWDPAAPVNADHIVMDNFCMSCHDADGATSPLSAGIRALMTAAPGKVAGPLNPFADTISNRYDKMQRPAVTNVSNQFDTANNSHHAVKGAKYSGRTRSGSTRVIASAGTFAANSSAHLQGVRKTIYDAGNFNALYSPLGTDGTAATGLGDDSTLHCGDCHTVGQWKPGSSETANGSATPVAIGAHGSNNEYLLRNTLGTDERHTQNAFLSAGGVVTYTNPNGAFLVCYNCHNYNKYGSIFLQTGVLGGHVGEYDAAGRCNGVGNTIPFNGYTTGTATDGTQFESRFLGPITKYSTSAPYAGEQQADFGNIFGIQCANCHNSGAGNGYGGIHGSYKNNSTAGKPLAAGTAATGGFYIDGMGNTTKMMRFLPGLGNAMHVPGTRGGITGGVLAVSTSATPYNYSTAGVSNDANWEQRHWQQVDGQIVNLTTGAVSGTTSVARGAGCYTLGASTAATTKIVAPTVTGSAAVGLATVSAPAVAGAGVEMLDTWGGCDDHGAAQGNGDHGFVKKIVRPVTY